MAEYGIPYMGSKSSICEELVTAAYDEEFNHKLFYEWPATNKHPVFISEYNISDKRFKVLFSIKKRSLFLSSGPRETKLEKVYANDIAFKMLIKKGVS